MGGQYDKNFTTRAVQGMGFMSLLALRAAVINLRQNGHGVMWPAPGTNATLATNPYLGPWAPQVPGVMGPWGPAASQQIITAARQLLDDWCAMTDLERQEAIAFRDWYSPNIQP